jgi:hypothetical protein
MAAAAVVAAASPSQAEQPSTTDRHAYIAPGGGRVARTLLVQPLPSWEAEAEAETRAGGDEAHAEQADGVARTEQGASSPLASPSPPTALGPPLLVLSPQPPLLVLSPQPPLLVLSPQPPLLVLSPELQALAEQAAAAAAAAAVSDALMLHACDDDDDDDERSDDADSEGSARGRSTPVVVTQQAEAEAVMAFASLFRRRTLMATSASGERLLDPAANAHAAEDGVAEVAEAAVARWVAEAVAAATVSEAVCLPSLCLPHRLYPCVSLTVSLGVSHCASLTVSLTVSPSPSLSVCLPLQEQETVEAPPSRLEAAAEKRSLKVEPSRVAAAEGQVQDEAEAEAEAAALFAAAVSDALTMHVADEDTLEERATPVVTQQACACHASRVRVSLSLSISAVRRRAAELRPLTPTLDLTVDCLKAPLTLSLACAWSVCVCVYRWRISHGSLSRPQGAAHHAAQRRGVAGDGGTPPTRSPQKAPSPGPSPGAAARAWRGEPQLSSTSSASSPAAAAALMMLADGEYSSILLGTVVH